MARFEDSLDRYIQDEHDNRDLNEEEEDEDCTPPRDCMDCGECKKRKRYELTAKEYNFIEDKDR